MKKEEIKKLLDQFEAAANIVEGIECWSARLSNLCFQKIS